MIGDIRMTASEARWPQSMYDFDLTEAVADPELDDAMRRLTEAISREWLRQRENQLRALLCMWVSGAEPQLVVDASGALLGLAVAGDPDARLIVR